jgi:hypothetical protein
MTKFDDFKPSDRVRHSSMGEGVVVSGEAGFEAGFVHVQYASDRSRGKYDRRWFELCPDFLVHATDRWKGRTGR